MKAHMSELAKRLLADPVTRAQIRSGGIVAGKYRLVLVPTRQKE